MKKDAMNVVSLSHQRLHELSLARKRPGNWKLDETVAFLTPEYNSKKGFIWRYAEARTSLVFIHAFLSQFTHSSVCFYSVPFPEAAVRASSCSINLVKASRGWAPSMFAR